MSSYYPSILRSLRKVCKPSYQHETTKVSESKMKMNWKKAEILLLQKDDLKRSWRMSVWLVQEVLSHKSGVLSQTLEKLYIQKKEWEVLFFPKQSYRWRSGCVRLPSSTNQMLLFRFRTSMSRVRPMVTKNRILISVIRFINQELSLGYSYHFKGHFSSWLNHRL